MQIYNIDEMGINVVHKPGKIVAEIGRRKVWLVTSAGTMFTCSESGWINQSLFLDWFKFFIMSIPPARPVLIIEDGHSSHV